MILGSVRELPNFDGSKVVTTNGCYDVRLHIGHLALLKYAKSLGDVLIVIVNTDASIRRLKGKPRPYVTFAERAALLDAIGWIEYAIPMQHDNPVPELKAINPHIHVKGSDYDKNIPEYKTVRKVVFFPIMKKYSTTALIERIRKNG